MSQASRTRLQTVSAAGVWSLLIVLAAIVFVHTEPARGITVVIEGGDGIPGVDGADESSGVDGQFGGRGGNAEFLAGVLGDASNVADGTGGDGGAGGKGGNAIDPDGSGGHGGHGGDGGLARTDAQTSNARTIATAVAISEGGAGGTGGNGENGGELGTAGRGGDGGRGGNAHAHASAGSSVEGAAVTASATAIGGRGGDGGAGGSPGQSIDGSGGDGGSASLSPVTGRSLGGPVQAHARAVGGAGGNGTGSGWGGRGIAVNIGNIVSGETTGPLILSQEAVGGRGGNAEDGLSGSGGSANNSLFIFNNDAESIEAGVVATGGRGGDSSLRNGSDGATARADASVRGVGPVTVKVEATGGRGGDGGVNGNGRGGDGETASGNARAESSGGDDASATLLLKGGAGGNGASGGNGANAHASGNVSGQTTGTLELIQSAVGGDAGAGLAGAAGNAGDASSMAGFHQDGPSTIFLTSEAVAGHGASGLEVRPAATAQSAIFVTSSTATSISLYASAIGGWGGSIEGAESYGSAAHGGSADVQNVHVVSTSPSAVAIDAAAEVQGGRGGDIAGMGRAGDGAPGRLFNRVDGIASPSSSVALHQIARGGSGGNSMGGEAGRGGGASARVTRTKDVAYLSLQQTAYGGNGGNRSHMFGSAGDAGGADAWSEAENTGITHSDAAAYAGDGGNGADGAHGGRGGDADADARAINSSDQTVTVFATAVGGDGGEAEGDGQAGEPGTARTRAYGESRGGGAVDVTARTVGGNGGDAEDGDASRGADAFAHERVSGSTSGLLKLHQESQAGNGGSSSRHGGRGGVGSSRLNADNPGHGPIEGRVTALGGNGGQGLGPGIPGVGGDANASIYVSGKSNNALAVSEATAGRGGASENDNHIVQHGFALSEAAAETSLGFPAEARATMNGWHGRASAESKTSGGAITSATYHAHASASGDRDADATSVAAHSLVALGGSFTADATGATVVSRGSIMPTIGVVGNHLVGDPNVKEAFADNVSTPLSLVALGFNSVTDPNVARSASAEFDFDLTKFSQGNLIVGLLDPVGYVAEETIHLQLTINRDGGTVLQQEFGTLVDALAYFDDRVLDLGMMTPGNSETPDLSISLSMSSPDLDARFGVTMLVASVGGDPAEFESDFDDDGDVDADDLAAWQGNFGASATAEPLAGDADGDADVDGRDLLVWQRQLGGGIQPGVNSAAAAGAVPEPGAMMLSLLGVTIALTSRSLRQQRS